MQLLNKKFFFVFIILFLAKNGLAVKNISVFVSIVPQKYFVQQIGKDLIDIQVMVNPGANPATYEPTSKQMIKLSKADIYFAVGVPFEKIWLKKISSINPKMKILHTDQNINKIVMSTNYLHIDKNQELYKKNYYNKDKEKKIHKSINYDPHIWLSPQLVKIQAQSIMESLRDIDSKNRNFYENNFIDFSKRIDQLDDNLKKIFKDKKGLEFMVFHPAWGYFAKAYGIRQVPVEIEGKAPKPAHLKELIQYARNRGIRVVFVQPQFSTKSVKILAKEIKGQIIFADPLAEDWMTNLRKVADNFKAALK